MLTNREHVIALEARDKGLVGLLLRYPYEVRQSGEYFDGIQDVKLTKDMLDLAKHIVDQKSGHFEPEKFEDNYETALIDLINQKRAGQPVAKVKVKTEGNVINLMDALRQSLKGKAPAKAQEKVQDKEEEAAPATKAPAKKANGKSKKPAANQREMLFALEGKGQKAAKADTKRETAKRPARAPARQKRAG